MSLNWQFSKFAQNSPDSDFHIKQVSHPPILDIDDDKKWCPFSDPKTHFLHPKSMEMAEKIKFVRTTEIS